MSTYEISDALTDTWEIDDWYHTWTLTKTGSITVDGTAIDVTGGRNSIYINGVVDAGGVGIDVHTTDFLMFVKVSGTLSGGTAAIQDGDDMLTVAVSGKVNGDVSLGGGNDMFELMSRGKITGTVYGGAGNDVYGFLNHKSFTISEDVDGGDDTVLAKYNYTLGDNLENLYSSGRKAIGNSLDNIMVGLRNGSHLFGLDGDDLFFFQSNQLGFEKFTGGGGDDVFLIAAGTGARGVVTDFEQGHDKIGTYEITSFDKLIITQHGDNTWIQAEVGREHREMILQNFDASKLTAEDFIFDYPPPVGWSF